MDTKKNMGKPTAAKESEKLLDKEFEKIPNIGITPRQGTKNNLPTLFHYKGYSSAITELGGIPYMLTMNTTDNDRLSQIVSSMDGLIITGGEDLDPIRYHAKKHELTGTPDKEKEKFEFRLIEKALEYGKPILAVCGGSHKLNVVYGGNLIQDIETRIDSKIYHNNKTMRDQGIHEVRVVNEDSLFTKMYGSKPFMVNSTHHQASHNLGSGLVTTLIADDEIIEGFRDPSKPYVIGVQFHPEALFNQPGYEKNLNLFKKLVDISKGELR